MRKGLVTAELPLTGDSVYSDVQRDLVRPVSISAQMANDTFLRDWAETGESDATKVTRFLNEISRKFQTVTSFYVSDTTRRYYHNTGILKTVSEQSADDTWYFRARNLPGDYEINVDTDTADRKRTTVFINYRVVNAQKKFLGITGVGLELKSIDRRIAQYERKFRRNIYFVDNEGVVVLANGSGTYRRGANIRNTAGVSAIAESVLIGRERPLKLRYTRNGADVFVNARYLPELRWHLIVEQDDESSVRPLYNALWQDIAVGMVVSMLTGLAMFYFIRRFQRHLQLAASTDELTGALNRRAGENRLADAFNHFQRSSVPMSLLLIDVDRFKSINDTYGHHTGDQVLQNLVTTLRSRCRANDTIVRWGGEEFVMVLPDCGLGDAERIADVIRVGVEQMHLQNPQRLPGCTVSIGLASSTIGESLQSMLISADQALYKAKQSGRNRVSVALQTVEDLRSPSDLVPQ